MYIAGRERKLIELLLENESAITVKELAIQLEVSVRTIHRDLKNIETILKHFQISLIKKSGVGLLVKGASNHKLELQQAMTGIASNDYTPEERQPIILAALFAAKEPIKLLKLASDLKVTIATISHDLDELEKQLSEFKLILIRKRGLGVQISGAEQDKRQAISHLITKYIDPFELVNLYKDNMKKNVGQQTNIEERLLGFVQADRLEMIEKAVDHIKQKLPYELADNAYIALIVHLALAIERLKNGDNIDFDQAYLQQIADKEEYKTATLLIQQLEKDLHMVIPKGEIGYITMHLLGAKLRVDPYYVIEDSAMDVAYKAKELIHYVSTILNVQFNQSTTLLNDLVAHLKPAIYRMKKDMKITNPIIDEIKRDYGELFRLLQDGVEEVFPGLSFPDDEVGYLVLHFGAVLFYDTSVKHVRTLVICASGIGTAKILASQLQQQFSEMTDVKVISMFELATVNTEAYDLILSTVTLQDTTTPYIIVSPILTEKEKLQIKHALRKVLVSPQQPIQVEVNENVDYTKHIEQIHHYTTSILTLLRGFKVMEWKQTSSIKMLLYHICKDLKAATYLHNEDAVYNKLLLREKIGGMGFPNSTVALYHTRTNEVTQPCFMIYRIQKPTVVKGMQNVAQELDTILMMLAPVDTKQEDLEVLSFISSLLVQHNKALSLFAKARESEVKQFLSQQLFTFLTDKRA